METRGVSVNNRAQMTAGTFYASATGRLCLREACAALDSLWDDLRGKRILTIGYATPFYTYFQEKNPQSVTEMDFEDSPEKTLSLKAPESSFPFKSETFDRIFSTAALERAFLPNVFLREVRRVLREDGSLVLMTLNKRRLCRQYEPCAAFGGAKTYAASQIVRLLDANLLQTDAQKSFLYFPPQAYDKTDFTEKAERCLQKYAFFNGAFIMTKASRVNALSVPCIEREAQREGEFSLLPAYKRDSRGKGC